MQEWPHEYLVRQGSRFDQIQAGNRRLLERVSQPLRFSGCVEGIPRTDVALAVENPDTTRAASATV